MRLLRRLLPAKRVWAALLWFFTYLTFRARLTPIYVALADFTRGLITPEVIIFIFVVCGILVWVMPFGRRTLLIFSLPLLSFIGLLSLMAVIGGYPQFLTTMVLLLFFVLFALSHILDRWYPDA